MYKNYTKSSIAKVYQNQYTLYQNRYTLVFQYTLSSFCQTFAHCLQPLSALFATPVLRPLAPVLSNPPRKAIGHARQPVRPCFGQVQRGAQGQPTHTLPDRLPAHARTFASLFDEYELSQNYLRTICYLPLWEDEHQDTR